VVGAAVAVVVVVVVVVVVIVAVVVPRERNDYLNTDLSDKSKFGITSTFITLILQKYIQHNSFNLTSNNSEI
jgi:heme/copper-type cytochrome/quinol oxidase subunit 2